MDTWERIRELGVLRAAGMSRRQVWRSVLVEAGILGTIGGLVGSVAGLAVGALLLGFAGGLPSGIQVPWGTIAASPGPRRRAGDARGGPAGPDRRPAIDRGGRPEPRLGRSARVRGLCRGC